MIDHTARAMTAHVENEADRPLNAGIKKSLDSELETYFQERDQQEILGAIDWDVLFRTPRSPIHLLDVGRPSSFPRSLAPTLQFDCLVLYDSLRSSVHTTQQQAPLIPPFQFRHAFHTDLETCSTPFPSQTYDILWAMDSFPPLAFSQSDLSTVRRMLNPHRGTALIVSPTHAAFCHRMSAHYAQVFSLPSPEPPPLTAEQVLQNLTALGMPTIVRELDCVHCLSIRDEQRLDWYLRQCAKTDRPSDTWRYHPRMRDFLEMFRHDSDFRFPHPIWMILSVPPESGAAGRQRLYHYLKPVSTQLVA